MNENTYSPTKWLQYLLYAGIAAALNTILGFLLGDLSRWLGLAISAAAVYLLFRLVDANERYQKAAIFSIVALVAGLFTNVLLTLVGSVCSIVAQYQEYHAHSELIVERDPRLAGKWRTLFWLQFAVGLVLGLLLSFVSVILVMVSGLETAAATAVLALVLAVVTLILQVLYLVYLNRTVKLLENEIVVE